MLGHSPPPGRAHRLCPGFSVAAGHHGQVTSPVGPPNWPSEPPTEAPFAPFPGPGETAGSVLAAPAPPAEPVGPPELRPAPGPAARPARATAAPTTRSRQPWSVRDAVAIGLAAVAAVTLATGNLAVWADQTARDPLTFAEASVLDLGPGGLEALIHQRLTTAVVEAVDLERVIEENLPGPLATLGAPAEDLGRQVVDDAVTAVLAEPGISSLIDHIEGAADEELVALLLDDSDWLRLDGTMVVLDLDPLIADVADRIDDLIPDMLSDLAPVISADTLIPDSLEDGGVELELIEIPALTEAVTSLDTLDRLASTLPIIGAVAAVTAVVVARRRARALVALGAGVVVVATVLTLGQLAGLSPVLGSVTAPLEDIAGTTFADAAGGALITQSLVVIGAGAVLLGLGAWLLARRPGADAAPSVRAA